MAYSQETAELIKMTPKTLGTQLGKLALKYNYSVIDIAKYTGASRTTIYNWFRGRGVTNAYIPVVEALIEELKS